MKSMISRRFFLMLLPGLVAALLLSGLQPAHAASSGALKAKRKRLGETVRHLKGFQWSTDHAGGWTIYVGGGRPQAAAPTTTPASMFGALPASAAAVSNAAPAAPAAAVQAARPFYAARASLATHMHVVGGAERGLVGGGSSHPSRPLFQGGRPQQGPCNPDPLIGCL